jgi:glycosyltransferase involved in cell wall biosynthesis
MLPRQDTIALYSHATVFCCPSIYEPFGIINLEAMACNTPVVGSAVGGIREVVVDGETGILVDPHLSPEPPHDPVAPARFERGLAEAINRIANDPELWKRMCEAGRRRVEERYSWRSIAQQTYELYLRLRAQYSAEPQQ